MSGHRQISHHNVVHLAPPNKADRGGLPWYKVNTAYCNRRLGSSRDTPTIAAQSASASCMINLAAMSRNGNGLVTSFSSSKSPSGVSYPEHLKSTKYTPCSIS